MLNRAKPARRRRSGVGARTGALPISMRRATGRIPLARRPAPDVYTRSSRAGKYKPTPLWAVTPAKARPMQAGSSDARPAHARQPHMDARTCARRACSEPAAGRQPRSGRVQRDGNEKRERELPSHERVQPPPAVQARARWPRCDSPAQGRPCTHARHKASRTGAACACTYVPTQAASPFITVPVRTARELATRYEPTQPRGAITCRATGVQFARRRRRLLVR